MQEQTSRLYSLYTWQPGQQEMTLVASNMYRAGDYAQLKDLQERLENLKEDALAGTELPDAAHCFSMLVTDGEKVYGAGHENLHPRGGRLQLCPSSGHGGGIGQYCADADEHMGRQGPSDKPLRA